MAKPPDDEKEETPTKRKPSTTNNTPRKASASKMPNGPRTPNARRTSANKNSPANANVKTPTSAPARAATRKPEPTLLGDFLLGRPSPQRQRTARRKSLEVVKMEMRAELVGKVRAPGKVKERVKEWQKNIEKPVDDLSDEEVQDEIVVEVEEDSDDDNDDDRARRKDRGGKRPGRRKGPEEEEKENEKPRSKSASAPKKRVVSDSHWMKKIESEEKKEKKATPPAKKTNRIPKDFLQRTAVNPPVAKKIEDWIGRTPVVKSGGLSVDADNSGTKARESKKDSEGKPRSKHVSIFDDGIRVRPEEESPREERKSGQEPEDGIHVTSFKSPTTPDDRGIRIEPSKERPEHDAIRVTPSPGHDDTPTRRSKKTPSNDGIRIKPSRENSPDERSRSGSQRRSTDLPEMPTPKQRSEKHLRPPSFEARRATSHESSQMDVVEEDEELDKFSWMSPSPPEKSKRGARKSGSPASTEDVSFGDPAFSVVDLPVGAEAGTMRRPGPKRNNSFAKVPKVLKRVYTEGMKIVHDNAEPVRAGPNHPPSIESWLDSTSDPFVDRPATGTSSLEVPEHPSRRRSYKEDDRAERELTAERDESETRRKARSRRSPVDDQQDNSSSSTPRHRDALPSVENSPTSPAGLKRSPATRNVASPKSSRKTPLKEAIFDAFKGESAMKSKSASPSPFDFIGLRERELNRTSDYLARDLESVQEDTPTQSPRRVSVSSRTRFEEPVNEPVKPLPPFPRRQAPTTGVHRLSTIASVETFSTSTSATESSTETESSTDTGSEISKTTITQGTVFTAPTSSSLSRKSTKSKTGLKRRLTKHSDLLSVLSLPDTPPVERSKSVRSARSIRTTRRNLETATVQDLMREVAEDETKYMRELNTLVDGVIPVLLTSVLSKSDSAIAAGLLDPESATNSSFTKPIVDMGVALERLRSIHKRVPLEDSDSFLHWLESAQTIYDEYLRAWRSGFEGVVVNLAPSHGFDKMPRNSNGDVINENGEVVDVAYLLKRPLVRVKYLTRVVKGLNLAMPLDLFVKMIKDKMEKLEALSRRRAKEEAARREDLKANNTDPTRVRDLRTLKQMDGIKIDRRRGVFAKDTFSLEFPHSSGQIIECQVDIYLRDMPKDPSDADILIVEVGVDGRFLLFPPLDKNHISARMGDNDCELVVQFRGITRGEEWKECFILAAEDAEAAEYWLGVLGTVPIPPPIVRKEMVLDAALASEISINEPNYTGDVPLGERGRQALGKRRPRKQQKKGPTTLTECLKEHPEHRELAEMCIIDLKSLNAARELADLTPLTLRQKRPTPERYISAKIPVVVSGALPLPNEKEMINDDLHIQKSRTASSPATPEKISTPLKDSMRPDPETLQKKPTSTPIRTDGAPPPPAHRSPTTPNTLKKTPIIESPTPKARTRRTSSPLKHEWQPDDASSISPSDHADSESGSDSYSSSSEDELEAVDSPIDGTPAAVFRKPTPPDSIYSLSNAASVAPSNSASQAPYRGALVSKTEAETRKTTARMSYWKEDGFKSCWKDLWPDICSIVTTPGRIEAFEISAAHSSPTRGRGDMDTSGSSDPNRVLDPASDRPLVALDLTPLVTLRQSNAIDIEIRSPTLPQSRLKCRSNIRFRTLTPQDGNFLYGAVHYARMNNAVFLKLQEERRYANFGTHAYEQAIAPNIRRSLFGRQRSYRASARAPQSDMASEQSGKSSVAATLKRLSGGGLFNIAKSSINRDGPMSNSTSSSDYSGATPPGTPGSPSQADSSAYSQMPDFGWEDIPITFSHLATSTKWEERGSAYLTVSTPPPSMRPESSQYYGIPKRITVTKQKLHMGSPQGPNLDAHVIFDAAIGVGCFSLVARKGVLMHDWRDIRGSDGQIGVIGSTGGVAATIDKWLLQTERGIARDWIWSLTGGLYDRGGPRVPSGYGA